ncbi:MAG: TRAP transporter small permease [Sulfurospirillaceae bacterium]|nr:TRAP transporter small permease [Sulfurospirillaceae bacterium]
MKARFLTLSQKLSLGGAFIASGLLIALVLLILLEIILRYFFNTSTMRADEYSGYLYLAIVCFGFGYTFLHDGHIRITFLTAKISSKKSSLVDIFAGSITLVLLGFIFYRSVLLVWDSYQTGVVSEAVSATPIFIPQLALPIGIALFMISVIAFLVQRMFHDK